MYEVLEQRGLTVWLVDARQMKYVPGRKSDVQDCQWLQKLMSLGLLRAAWRPGDEVCVVRAVARQREVLLAEQASWVQRMQKALVQMNLQLTEVLTDVMGMTGQAIIRAIVAGERDPKVLARHRNGRVKASADDIDRALTGNWREEHLFVLGAGAGDVSTASPGACSSATRRPRRCWYRWGVTTSNWPGRTSSASKNTPRFRRAHRARHWAGVDLTRINGLAVDHGDDDTLRDRPGPEPLCQRQALLFVAGTVPGHQDQWRQGAVARAPGAPPTGCARRSRWRP